MGKLTFQKLNQWRMTRRKMARNIKRKPDKDEIVMGI
jgi:hypothetical protein